MMTGTCHCNAVNWRFDTTPTTATACNCTLCRRYGVLWAYGHDTHDVHISGNTHTYVHGDKAIAFHFCPICACVICWRSIDPDADGRHRTAVNLRLSAPDAVGNIPIRHFDGLETWADLPDDGRHVRDMWF